MGPDGRQALGRIVALVRRKQVRFIIVTPGLTRGHDIDGTNTEFR
jgi:hypothetical protein